jgi:N-acetylglucosaminyl-diphospho-decaprenol L-rhamnosyltransferase
MNAPPVSVIIVSYNVSDLLADCLRSIEGAARDLGGQVIVVDNASTDRTRQMLADQFPWVRLVANSTNVGFAAANNQGIRMQDAPYVMLLNPDTIVRGSALQDMRDAMGRHPNIGILGPRILSPDGTLQSGPLAFPTVKSLLTGRMQSDWPQLAPGIIEADWVLGAALMIRREVIEQIGLMDEGYFLYAEEKDWCYRAKQAGWKVGVLTTAEVVHLGKRSTAQCAPESFENLIKSQVRFLDKFYPPKLKWTYLVKTFAQAGLRECVARVLALRDGQWKYRAMTYRAGRRLAFQYLMGVSSS